MVRGFVTIWAILVVAVVASSDALFAILRSPKAFNKDAAILSAVRRAVIRNTSMDKKVARAALLRMQTTSEAVRRNENLYPAIKQHYEPPSDTAELENVDMNTYLTPRLKQFVGPSESGDNLSFQLGEGVESRHPLLDTSPRAMNWLFRRKKPSFLSFLNRYKNPFKAIHNSIWSKTKDSAKLKASASEEKVRLSTPVEPVYQSYGPDSMPNIPEEPTDLDLYKNTNRENSWSSLKNNGVHNKRQGQTYENQKNNKMSDFQFSETSSQTPLIKPKDTYKQPQIFPNNQNTYSSYKAPDVQTIRSPIQEYNNHIEVKKNPEKKYSKTQKRRPENLSKFPVKFLDQEPSIFQEIDPTYSGSLGASSFLPPQLKTQNKVYVTCFMFLCFESTKNILPLAFY